MILVKDVTADLDRRLYHQECALSQENLAVFGAESLHQLSITSTIKCVPNRPQTWAAAAPCCAVQLAPLIVRTSASAGMLAHGIRI